MKEQRFKLANVPALLLGDDSDKIFLFLHGKLGSKEEAAAFAEIACPAGWQVLGLDLPGHGQRPGAPTDLTPWAARPELQGAAAFLCQNWPLRAIRANSIGAWLAMLALAEEDWQQALFVSPLVDMEKLILAMLAWAGVTEQELAARGEIATSFGEVLSWQYLSYVRANPLRWRTPTKILYAAKDNLTDRATMDAFVRRQRAELTVSADGEHWFHTPEQLLELQAWECACLK